MAVGLDRHAAARPGEVALTDGTVSLTWAELDRRVDQLVAFLHARGIAEGRRLAIMSENSVHAAVAHLAGIYAGACVVPVNVHLRAEEAAYVVADADAALVLASGEAAARAREAVAVPVATWAGRPVAGVESLASVWHSDAPPAPADVVPVPNLLYTSGTSGRPKATALPPSMFPGGTDIGEYVDRLAAMPAAGAGTHLIVGPIYHTGPLSGVRLLPVGDPVVMMPRFDAVEVLAAIERHRVASTMMVPTHFARLLALPPATRERYDVESLRLVIHTGAPCPPQVKRSMIDWFGPILVEAYGSTEVGTVTMIDSPTWLAHPGSVGRALPHLRLSIRDDDGTELPADADGLVCVEMDGWTPAYVHDPEKTAASYVAPGVFAIGEIGHLDPEGYLHLTDRRTDLVISGGVNVYPAEAEAVLLDHPDVADVAVIGVPDPDMGEALHAVVVPAGPAGIDADDLIAWCRSRLTHYKCPRTIDTIGDLPRSQMGKLDKRALRERYAGTARAGVAR